nr:uncharacterized protein LOC109155623 isoform X1 [Ipomoea trifida]
MSPGAGLRRERRRGSGAPAVGAIGCGGGTSGVAGRTRGLKRRAPAPPRGIVVVSSGSDSPSRGPQAEIGRRRSARRAITHLPENYVANSSSSSDEDFKTGPRTLVGTEHAGQRFVRANNAPNAQPSDGVSINTKIKVTDTPGRLGHWVVSHFRPEDMSLHLPDGSRISVMRHDVADVFGMPTGAVTITECDTQIGNAFLSEWRGELRQPKGKVTITALCNELLTHSNGGVWFRRHFTVAVVSTLIESEHNGYVNQKTMHMFGDTDKIAELDWCGYVLKCLLLYVDRVVVGTRDNTRVRPVLKGWTTKMLNRREAREISAGGFGLGHLDTPLHVSNIHMQQTPLDGGDGVGQSHCATVPVHHTQQGTNNKTVVLQTPLDGGDGVGQSHCATVPVDHTQQGTNNKTVEEQLAEATKVLGTIVQHITDLVHQAPTVALGDVNFKTAMEHAQNFIDLAKVDLHAPTPSYTQRDDDFWGNPDNIRAMEQIVIDVQRRSTVADAPSFSLGLTQEFQVTMPTNTDNAVVYATPSHQSLSQPVIQGSAQERGALRAQGRERQCGPAVKHVPANDKGKQLMLHDDEATCVSVLPIIHTNVVWMWIKNSPGADLNQVLFEHKGCTARWRDFKTLQEGMNVSNLIVDAWVCVLNAREQPTTSPDPTRLFASTNTTVDTVMTTSTPRDQRLKWFSMRMRAERRMTPHRGPTPILGWGTIDMFIFPVIHGGQYYVMSVDMKHRRFDIIDHSSSQPSTKAKYGNAPETLQDLLASFLHTNGQPGRAVLLRTLKPKRMVMAWRVPTNNHDSGVYAMWHMESYLGQEPEEWNCGLLKGDVQQIVNLRKRFMHDIIMDEKNMHKDAVTVSLAH